MKLDEERLKRAHLHNLYLQIAVESGLLGLFGFIFFAVCVVLMMFKGLRRAPAGWPRFLAAAMFVSGCSFFAYNMVDIYRYHGVHFVAAVIMGAGVGLSRRRLQAGESS